MRKMIHGVLIGAASAAIAIIFFNAGLLNWMENATWDWRVRHFASKSTQTDSIRLIFLDQSSLDWGEMDGKDWKWPWPREVYAAVLDFCKRGGAKAVIFDIVFSENSPYAVSDDEALGKSIANFGSYVQALELGYQQGSNLAWPENTAGSQIHVEGLEKYLAYRQDARLVMPRANFPISEIASQTRYFGNVSGIMESDAIIRRSAPFRIFDGKFVPSLSLAAYVAGNPDAKLVIKDKTLYADNHPIPLDNDSNVILKYRGPTQTHQTRSMASVIESEIRVRGGDQPSFEPSFFTNAYVFVGFTTAGLRDLRPTPISREYPGVEIHATMLDNILANDLIRDISIGTVLISTIMFAVLAGLLGRSCSNWKLTVGCFVILLPLPFLPGLLLYSKNLWMPIAVQEFAVMFSLLFSVILNYALEGRQKRFIKSAFGQYLSPEIIEKLVKNPDSLKLGGESRILSIFFSDVQGFTSISEALTPEELTALLNDYLTAMATIIYEERGTIDKYEGDAIIAFWNAPVDDPDHARNAVRASLRCQRKLKELRPLFKDKTGKDMFARIGLNTGKVVVGNMGSIQRFNYTFLGDAGNLASRLEGINKEFGTYIMISESTKNELGDEFVCREISRVRVVGRQEPVRVFEPMFPEDADRSTMELFAKALQEFYDGNFCEALQMFSHLSDSDAVSKTYTERCRTLMNNPPDDWDGVCIMTSK